MARFTVALAETVLRLNEGDYVPLTRRGTVSAKATANRATSQYRRWLIHFQAVRRPITHFQIFKLD